METSAIVILASTVWSMTAVAFAWIGKEIIKPWSDTWRMKVVAEAEHLKNVDEALVKMVHESSKQTDSLSGIDQKMTQSLGKLDTLQQQGADAAKMLADKAIFTAKAGDRFELKDKQDDNQAEQ